MRKNIAPSGCVTGPGDMIIFANPKSPSMFAEGAAPCHVKLASQSKASLPVEGCGITRTVSRILILLLGGCLAGSAITSLTETCFPVGRLCCLGVS